MNLYPRTFDDAAGHIAREGPGRVYYGRNCHLQYDGTLHIHLVYNGYPIIEWVKNQSYIIVDTGGVRTDEALTIINNVITDGLYFLVRDVEGVWYIMAHVGERDARFVMRYEDKITLPVALRDEEEAELRRQQVERLQHK